MIIVTQYSDGYEVTTTLNHNALPEVISTGLIDKATADELIARSETMGQEVMTIEWLKDEPYVDPKDFIPFF